MDVWTVKRLMKLLYDINPYAKVYMHAKQMLAGRETAKLALIGVARPGCDPKHYNQPSVDEVAMVIEGDGEEIGLRHIILHWNDGAPVSISDLHSYYFPLRYPLLFPYREQQWDNLWRSNSQGSKVSFSNVQGGSYPFSQLVVEIDLFVQLLADRCDCWSGSPSCSFAARGSSPPSWRQERSRKR
jgi:hypothetical protein